MLRVSEPTERGDCEACGQPFTSTRNRHVLAQYRKFPAKRFCSEGCRKRAESARARQRRREAANA